MAHKYKLLIFDWDGTLMDSAAKIVACLHAAIDAAALPKKTDAQLRHIIGLGIHEAIDFLYPDGITLPARQALIDNYRQQFVHANQTPTALFEGVETMLAELRERGHYLAVATGKSRAGLDRLLAELEMQHYFYATRCADETCSKPDPQMLFEILADLDIGSAEALMIGDTEFDVHMAHNASMDAAAVSQGAHTLEQLQNSQPRIILDEITALPAWLNRQGRDTI